MHGSIPCEDRLVEKRIISFPAIILFSFSYSLFCSYLNSFTLLVAINIIIIFFLVICSYCVTFEVGSVLSN